MATNKIPQLQVLNYILTSQDSSLISLNNLNASYFRDFQLEFNYITDHLDKYGKVPDVETFFAAFPNCKRIAVNESPDFLIKNLCDDYNTKKIVDVVNAIKPALLEGRVDEAVAKIKDTMENMAQGIALHCIDLLKDTSRYDAYVERTQNFGKYYISTGFPELDQIVGGFDREEELATIVARTNFGKSWILLKCAVASCKQGLNVGIYSGEMSDRKVGYRVDTLIGNIPNGSLTHGNVEIQNVYKRYIDSLPDMFKGSLKVITPSMIGNLADVNTLKLFIEKEHLDVLYIDQLTLLEDQRNGRTPVEKMNNISKDLKKLQVMKKIPIISVHQQNRTASDDGDFNTTQIAGSDRIGQDSTMVVFLEKKDDVMKLHLKKSRDSENNKVITYHIDLNVGEFTYIPDAKDGIGGKQVEMNEQFEPQPEPEAIKDFIQGEDCF